MQHGPPHEHHTWFLQSGRARCSSSQLPADKAGGGTAKANGSCGFRFFFFDALGRFILLISLPRCFRCTYPAGTPLPPPTAPWIYLDASPNFRCWSALHALLAAVAVAMLVVLYPMALNYVAFVKNNTNPAMRLLPRFNVIFVAVKVRLFGYSGHAAVENSHLARPHENARPYSWEDMQAFAEVGIHSARAVRYSNFETRALFLKRTPDPGAPPAQLQCASIRLGSL